MFSFGELVSQRLEGDLNFRMIWRGGYRTGFRKNKPGYNWSLNLDLQNLTNRLNLYQEYYNVADQRLERYTYSGLIPNLNYKINF